MESQNIEFRAVIKFLIKEGAKAKEIHWRQRFVCLYCGFTAQSTQWGHVKRGQFT